MEENGVPEPIRRHRCVLAYQEPFSFPVCKECGIAYMRPAAAAGSGAVTVQPLFDSALLLLDLRRKIDTVPRDKMRTYLENLSKDPDMGSAFAWFAADHGFDLSEAGAF